VSAAGVAEATSRWPSFDLDPGRSATEPPEAGGGGRDEVRLLVAEPARMHHLRFRDLPSRLEPGDLVVVNTSATSPSATDGRRADGREVTVHLSGPHPAEDGTWLIELRRPDGTGPMLDAVRDETITLGDGTELRLLEPHESVMVGAPRRSRRPRLWRSAARGHEPLDRILERTGRPVSYGHLAGRWPLRAHQTVFGREPGSAEMVSAARPFTHELVTDLAVRGVAVAPVRLHTGVSSLERDEAPPAERFAVPAATARLAAHARAHGGRVVAVGTTVTRALESALDPEGRVVARDGWTDLVLGPSRPARLVTGLVTGWHGPDASHLLLLEAVAGAGLVRRAYEAALGEAYRWHEFGDSCLFLP
jgi:S-adenosylmethionine:tRNA ribosyltransferase-isomerase